MHEILMPNAGVVVPPSLTGRIPDKLYAGQWYEWKMLAYIWGLKLPGAYVDVGANIGNHSVFFAMNTPASKVFSVEPSLQWLPVLRQFISSNGVSEKVHVLPFAATDEAAAEVKISNLLDEPEPVYAVEGKRLDEMITEPVSLIKMDIEGAEPYALRGATRLLSEYKPRLFIEAHEEYELAEILSIIQPFGYRATGKFWNASPTHEFIAD